MITIEDLAAEITRTVTPLSADKVAKATQKPLHLAATPGPTDEISDIDADKVREAARERAARISARAKEDQDWANGYTPLPARRRTSTGRRSSISSDVRDWMNEEAGHC